MKSVLFVVLAAVLCLSAGVRADSDASYTDTEELSLAEVSSETQANEAAVAAAQSASETEAEMAADIASHLQADAEAQTEVQSAQQAAASVDQESQQQQGMDMGMDMDMSAEGPAPIARLTRRSRGAAAPMPKPAPKGKKPRRLIAPRPRMQPIKFHSERIEAQGTNRFEDPELGKLNLALDAVKEDILSTNKQINDERKWVIAVAKIIASYNDKMKRVELHIVQLRKEMKALYRKKKQIENLKLQRALEAKLKEARDELSVLTNSLKHVAVKQGELNKSGADLRQTIAGIQGQLAKLRGQQLRKRKPRPAAKGKGKRRGRGRGRRGGKRRGGRRAAKKGKRCKKGFRFSKKTKRCVQVRRRK